MSKRTPTKHRTAAAPTLLDTLKEVWDQAQDVCEMDADTARATLLEIVLLGGYSRGLAQSRLEIRGVDPLLAVPVASKRTPNLARAERAQDALATYIDMDDTRSAVIDLLTDLRHYCDHNDIDLGAANKVAHQHYLAELSGE